MQTDINHHFDLNSCSHGVKIEVKQVDDNYTWIYYENQYLYVELSDFVIMMKVAPVTRQLIPKTSRTQERHISFVWRHRH